MQKPSQNNIDLFTLIGWIETKNVPTQLRFEPAVYANILKGRAVFSDRSVEREKVIVKIQEFNPETKLDNVSRGTADMVYSTSWGSAQMMGFNLYGELKYRKTIGEFLFNIEDQRTAFTDFCVNHNINYCVAELEASSLSRRRFAKIYNGEKGELTYSTKIVEGLRFFGRPVVVERL